MNINMVQKVYSHLTDEISRNIFMTYLTSYAKYDYSLKNELPKYNPSYNETVHKTMKNVEQKIISARTIVICGGKHSDYVIKHLELFFQFDFSIIGIDSQAHTKDFGNEIEWVTYEEYFTRHNDNAVFLISPHIQNTIDAIKRTLTKFEVKEEMLIEFSQYYSTYNKLLNLQYFDYLIPIEGEVFVDGGAYDGKTILRFLEWCNGKYQKIFAFEPGEKQYLQTVNTVNNLKNIKVFNSGLWETSGCLKFYEDKSYINSPGFSLESLNSSLRGSINKYNNEYCEIKTLSLDDALHGEPITYIKLDVEGAELNTLKGARSIITHNKPRLAISIYHRPEDFFEIPAYIFELCPDYRFALRHYTYSMGETVLYAFQKDIVKFL